MLFRHSFSLVPAGIHVINYDMLLKTDHKSQVSVATLPYQTVFFLDLGDL